MGSLKIICFNFEQLARVALFVKLFFKIFKLIQLQLLSTMSNLSFWKGLKMKQNKTRNDYFQIETKKGA